MDIKTRIKQVNEQILESARAARKQSTNSSMAASDALQGGSNVEIASTPTDYYQTARNARYEASKRSYPNGANPKVIVDVKTVTEGRDGSRGLANARKKAKYDSDLLKKNGDTARARMVVDQYMEDYYFPTVEAVVRLNSADELLNSRKALELLDECALLNEGSASGYTASYVRQMYNDEAGTTSRQSDGVVRGAIREIVSLVQNDQIRAAVGKATKIMSKIDSGDNVASDEDYELISKVAMRGM